MQPTTLTSRYIVPGTKACVTYTRYIIPTSSFIVPVWSWNFFFAKRHTLEYLKERNLLIFFSVRDQQKWPLKNHNHGQCIWPCHLTKYQNTLLVLISSYQINFWTREKCILIYYSGKIIRERDREREEYSKWDYLLILFLER